MPNHVTNKLEFDGPEEKIKELIDRFSTLHPSVPRMTDNFGLDEIEQLEIWRHKTNNSVCWRDPATGKFSRRANREREPRPFNDIDVDEWEQEYTTEFLEFPDFQKIIPRPESLDCSSGSYGELGYAILTRKGTAWAPYEVMLDRFEKMDEKEREVVLEQGRMYKYNMEHHGYTSWYDWSIAKWGTKWSAYSFREENGGYYFDTAWSPPEPIIKKISDEFPEVKITHSFFDEGWCFFGIHEWLAGECSVLQDGSGDDVRDTLVGVGLCKDLKGYDPTEEDEEDEEIEVELIDDSNHGAKEEDDDA